MAASRTTRKFRKQSKNTRRKGGKRGPPASRSGSTQTFLSHNIKNNNCNPRVHKYYQNAWNNFQKETNNKEINDKLIENALPEDREKSAKLKNFYKNAKKHEIGPQLDDDIFIDYNEGDSCQKKNLRCKINLSKLHGKKGGKKHHLEIH